MISYMGLQQRKQMEGLEEVARFTSAELGLFVSDVYPSLLEQVHQALAKVILASQWLSEDMTTLGDNINQSQLPSLFASIESNKSKVMRIMFTLLLLVLVLLLLLVLVLVLVLLQIVLV